jgi:VanZ family protein
MAASSEHPSRLNRFVRYHLPVILYALGIIALSSIPDLRPPILPDRGVDKLAHFLEYAIFAALVFRSFYHLGKHANLRRTLLISALFVSVFALLDELYQHFVPGRYSDWRDLLTDIAGALLILALLGLLRRRNRRKSY